MKRATRHRAVRAHRWLGLSATVPLLGWIASSFVLHGVGLALPENGLRGDYELRPFARQRTSEGSADEGEDRDAGAPAQDGVRSDPLAAAPVSPTELLARLADDGLDRVYWLRLTWLAGDPAYVVKPGPFALERVYDARTGERLDPLPRKTLLEVANGELVGTMAASAQRAPEFNRYYAAEEVPAVRFRMEGEQPSELVLSEASGRTLSRTDPLAAWFERAYLSVHVWQWGEDVRLFTALLYGLAAVAVTVVLLGSLLWVDRRRRGGLPPGTRTSRKVHGTLAPVAGALLVTQMLVGAYLWYNLGPIEPRFRGQGSFQTEWTGGIDVRDTLASPARVAAALEASDGTHGYGLGVGASTSADAGPADGRAPPIQAYEWRRAGGTRIWLAYPRRAREGLLFDAATGRPLERLDSATARRAADAVVLGGPVEYRGESSEYWMDVNRRIPTYLYRFDDPDRTDVHVSRKTGEVVQRRPAIWRGFGPFLVYHTFAFTGNAVLDTVLLSTLQLAILAMIVTGWALALPFRSRAPESS